MNEFPWGLPLSEEEARARWSPQDTSITPDRVSPAIEGYFRIPAVWVGEAPNTADVRSLNNHIHHAIIFRKTLKCGIEARVQRDGTFWFDFSVWPGAPIVEIPGYRNPTGNGPIRVPTFHSDAENRAEQYAVVRAQVMNVHQACLISSESIVKNRGAMMGFPITSWGTEKALSWTSLRSYTDDSENPHALARNVLNNSYAIIRDRPLGRRVIELNVVDHSLDMLDKILQQGQHEVLAIVEALYMAACRNTEKRYGEALTLAWSVCEQAIFVMWNEHLEEINSKSDDDRINKERRKKLSGRDYTSSIVIESLELSEKIDRQTYRMLDVCRRARNNWAHRLKSPKSSESDVCLRVAEKMVQQVFRVPIRLQYHGRGGVPQWPSWMWREVKQHIG